MVTDKIVQSVFVCVAVAEGYQAGESLKKPRICSIDPLI